MKKLLVIFFLISFLTSSSFSMTSEKLERLKYKAKTDIAKLAIQKNCKKEYTGLEIDSEVADALFFSKACRCAIKSGKLSEISKVKKTLRLCEL